MPLQAREPRKGQAGSQDRPSSNRSSADGVDERSPNSERQSGFACSPQQVIESKCASEDSDASGMQELQNEVFDTTKRRKLVRQVIGWTARKEGRVEKPKPVGPRGHYTAVEEFNSVSSRYSSQLSEAVARGRTTYSCC